MKTIVLRPGKERSLQRRHPWVFESSIASGRADPGETVRVAASDGRFMAWAAYSPTSAIRLRAWSFDEAERIDAGFFERRIAKALAERARHAIASDGQRLVHGEADGLPGLIVDRYADLLSVQFLAVGVERWKATLADQLLQATGLTRLYERSDTSARKLEGLEPVAGWLRGGGDAGGHDPRARLAPDAGRGRGPQDRLLPRPARQPAPASARAVRHYGAEPGAQLLLLHRRLQRRGAGRAARPT